MYISEIHSKASFLNLRFCRYFRFTPETPKTAKPPNSNIKHAVGKLANYKPDKNNRSGSRVHLNRLATGMVYTPDIAAFGSHAKQRFVLCQ
jgi:hypothetical protein